MWHLKKLKQINATYISLRRLLLVELSFLNTNTNVFQVNIRLVILGNAKKEKNIEMMAKF